MIRLRALTRLLAGAVVAVAMPAAAQSLDATITTTLANAPDLAVARAGEQGARARLDAARAEQLPQVVAEGQLGVGRIDPRGFFGLAAADTTPRSARLAADVPLFAGGRVRAGVAQARAGLDIALAERDATERSLRVDVVRAYANAVAAAQTVASLQATITTLSEARRQAGLRFEAGKGTSTEVAQADARLAEARAGLAQADGARRAALAALKALSGSEIQPDADLMPPAALEMTRIAAIEQALASHPAIVAAQRAVDAADAGLSGARAQRLPVIGAYAEAASVRDQSFPGYKADSASVGLRARWTLVGGGRIAAGVRLAAADLAAREAGLRATRAAVERHTVEAYDGLLSAREAWAAAVARETAAEAAVRSARLEVQAGSLPLLAELDAERERTAAAAARIAAAGEMHVAAQMLQSFVGAP
ncbi:MAG: TolC family protein [Alphaproteobacteria bacterium]|nr:TolC family protein [Alphaproteobacteria bacterium]